MSIARDEMNGLLNVCLPFARQMIEQHGEFHPFAASITADGNAQLDAAYSGEERPPGPELVELLTVALRSKVEEGGIRAAAICANVSVRQPDGKASDAIQVAIEHRDADPAIVLMPYAKKRMTGYEFDELSGSAGVRSVFPS